MSKGNPKPIDLKADIRNRPQGERLIQELYCYGMKTIRITVKPIIGSVRIELSSKQDNYNAKTEGWSDGDEPAVVDGDRGGATTWRLKIYGVGEPKTTIIVS